LRAHCGDHRNDDCRYSGCGDIASSIQQHHCQCA
jgi:hypothetical protein